MYVLTYEESLHWIYLSRQRIEKAQEGLTQNLETAQKNNEIHDNHWYMDVDELNSTIR